MKFTSKQGIMVLGALVLLIVVVVLVVFNIRDNPKKGPPVTLSFWGFEDPAVLKPAIESYQKFRPNVKVNYRKIAEENYDQLLLEALASGQGPDVLPILDRSLSRMKSKLQPAPQELFSITKFRNAFPRVAETDFVDASAIYAFPLYMDTLALIYNRDFFDQAGIVYPPKTWGEFQEDVRILKRVDQAGLIERAGAAIGGSKRTIATAADTLQLLMMQSETTMLEPTLRMAAFANENQETKENPGLAAFNFYLQFSNPRSNFYTWNDAEPFSTTAFSGEHVAMIFGYRSDVEKIKKANPFISLGVAPIPQIDGATKNVDIASYSGLAVSKQSKVGGWGWDFISYITTNKNVIDSYLTATGRLPAFLPLIEERKDDAEIGVFVRQALTARSWKQPDERKVDEIFSGAIYKVLIGQLASEAALTQAEDQVSALFRGI